MSEMRQNLLVGLFMIAGLGALGGLMVMFGETPSWLGGAEWELHIVVDEISGVDEGTPIYLNGIKIGRVTSLQFKNPDQPQQGVNVVGKIKKQFIVPQGARAVCYGPTMGLGRGRVEITATGAGMGSLKPGEPITGTSKNPMEDIIPQAMLDSFESTVTRIGRFAETLTPVAQDLHGLLQKRPVTQVDAQQATANFSTAIERLDTVLKRTDQIVGDPRLRGGLLEAIENIRVMSADGKATFANLRDTSTNLKADTSRLAGKLDATLDHLDERVGQVTDAALPALDDTARTAANLKVITQRLVDGEGTLGKLLTDERLYEVVVLSVERTRDLIDIMRRLFSRFEKKGRIGLDVGGWPADQKVPPKQ